MLAFGVKPKSRSGVELSAQVTGNITELHAHQLLAGLKVEIHGQHPWKGA